MSIIQLNTSEGPIKIKLASEQTPQTCENFLRYVNEGFYDNTIFHRVIKGFMIQGGGMLEDMSEKTTHDPIQNEARTGLKNKIGTISMARTSDPHSASSQFFINVADNGFLDFKSETIDGYGYCAFGEVIEGLEIVEKISLTETTSKANHMDVPANAITIISATQVAKHIA